MCVDRIHPSATRAEGHGISLIPFFTAILKLYVDEIEDKIGHDETESTLSMPYSMGRI